MAFREVVVDPLPDLPPFVDFKLIGDQFGGLFVSYGTSEGRFGTENHYTFRNKTGTHVVNANFDLHRKLQAAKLQPNWAVLISYTNDIPSKTPGRSPMRCFKVMIDDTPRGAPPPPPVAPPPSDPFAGL